jgi:hypothetical protein
MADRPNSRMPETGMDAASLYREEIYTDRGAATLRVMVPVKTDGSEDTLRARVYLGEAQIMTNMGPLPVSFEIEARSLAEAVARYGDAARAGIERAVKELQELRRQASSSLIVPPAGAASALTGGGLGGAGGLGGGGKIQLP